MGRQILYRRGHIIVIKSFCKKGAYHTIVNTRTRKHSHTHENELIAAIMICKHAFKRNIPEKYPDWMRESIRRVMDDDGR